MGSSLFKLDLSGEVKFSRIEEGKEVEVATSHNNILPSASEILCKRLINLQSSIVDTISIYDGSTLLGNCPIFDSNYNIERNCVEFLAQVTDEILPTGTITDCILNSAGSELELAKLADQNLTKTLGTPIIISWTIYII